MDVHQMQSEDNMIYHEFDASFNNNNIDSNKSVPQMHQQQNDEHPNEQLFAHHYDDINAYHDTKSEICSSPNDEEDLYQHQGTSISMPSTGKDRYCWSCHKDRINVHCKICPRSYHLKCIPAGSLANNKTDSWLCLECQEIMNEEESLSSQSSRSTLSRMSVEELSQLLKFALNTIRQSADPTFHKPVSPLVFPDYHQLVHHPMDISTIEKNIRSKVYSSQIAFLADIKWIVHNCIIYNHANHPLTNNAKYLSRVAKNEMAEMEICPDCFRNFYTITESSFAEPCSKPHTLVFARVKGYPLWPAKVVRRGKQNEVDCRFFGTHDRAWVAVDSCWLLSEVHPGAKPSKSHKTKFDGAMRELALHVERLNARFPGRFKFAPQKTPFSPDKLFIFDEDNLEISVTSNDSKVEIKQKQEEPESVNNSNNKEATVNNNNSNTKVAPGVFSLSSEKVLDEFKNELKVDSIYNKNAKLSLNVQIDANSKIRTARVGKRNVAEALRASKVLRTSSNPSQSPMRSPSNSNSNNSHHSSSSSSQKSRTGASPDLRDEIEMLRKQIAFDDAMHQEEISEIKHNNDLVLFEMRASWVNEKEKAIEDERKKAELERKILLAQFEQEKKKLMTQIEDTKKKQWCAQCLKEARLFCCYDTWYCDYPCQKEHWKSHVNVCQQIQKKT